MRSMRTTSTVLLALSFSVLSAERERSYPLWHGESVEAYAKKVGLPSTKTLDLGSGVTMEFVLIPAGKFMMGTPKPFRVDEEHFQIQKWTGQTGVAVSAGVLLAMLAFVIIRAIRDRHRPQLSLRRLLVLALVSGVGVLSGLHWWYSEQERKEAFAEYYSGYARYAEAYASEENPAHNVTITTPFYMGKYEVTQEQGRQVMGSNPSQFRGGSDLPVETVSWLGAHEFCKRVQEKTGVILRLPSEAQWEYACRAGTRTAYYSGDDEASLDRVGWYGGNCGGKTHPVGQKEANVFGLYDMHGNVGEWCEDDWHDDYTGAPTDGSAWIDKPRYHRRVVRGGSWGFVSRPLKMRSAWRDYKWPYDGHDSIGFRCVLVQPE